jgi:energy-coupling factor transporter ATP-binding protein EcfA2
MPVLQEILAWSKTIPAWQSDAISRLLAKQKLEGSDLDDLFALLKASQGIADPKGRTPTPMTADQVPAPIQLATHVSLLAIKNLSRVNAIAPNRRLPIGATGLTVIYGDNGAGKSGYTRILKRACRARDQSEPILPNAHQPPARALAEADFEISINGGPPQDVHWKFGAPAPAELSTISIFDARCARAYLDTEDDFSYVPYGLDVFEGLARACGDLKTMLDTEYKQFAADLTVFANLHGDTAVGRVVSGLTAKTVPATVEALATLKPEEVERHTELEKGLKENNPKEKATRLRAFARRVLTIWTAATEKGALVDKPAVEKLKNLSDSYRTAKVAAALAAKSFKESEDLLPGTGGEAWRELFDAARKFVVESHPDRSFPDLGEGSPCPLCQQPLAGGAKRLLRFEGFIQQDAEKNAQSRRLALHAQYKAFGALTLSLGLDDVTYGEIEAIDKALADGARSFEAALGQRQKLIENAIVENDWAGTDVEIPSPASRLKALADKLNAEAETLEKASTQKAREALQKEFAELDARMKLSVVKDAVLVAISRLVHQAALKKCLADLKTTSISVKSSEIAEQIVSSALEKALNDEFKALGVGKLSVTLKSRGDRGKALHKLKLDLPRTPNPGGILSEGEQRAIAIGSFLAEIGLGGGKGGVVFDDPVSSLDHLRRERVAARLAAEAGKRQVIVFTHDIYFLCVLEEQAKEIGVAIATQSLVRRPEGFGVADAELPFEAKSVTKRIGALKAQQQLIAKLHKDNDEAEHRKQTVEAYFRLRMSWERAVEEVLLRSVVLRFRKGIETQKLSGVTVTDDDYQAVKVGMAKCSNYAHDKALQGGIAVPDPDELLEDITSLDAWRSEVDVRSKNTTSARK